MTPSICMSHQLPSMKWLQAVKLCHCLVLYLCPSNSAVLISIFVFWGKWLVHSDQLQLTKLLYSMTELLQTCKHDQAIDKCHLFLSAVFAQGRCCNWPSYFNIPCEAP